MDSAKWYTWVFSGVGVAIFTPLTSALVSWLGTFGGIAASIFFVVLVTQFFTKAYYFEGLQLLERGEVNRKIGSMEERLGRAKRSVCISGNDGKFVAGSCSAHVGAALNRGVRIQLLLVDPNSEVAEMLEQIDPRFPTAQDFRDSIMANDFQHQLREWKTNFPTLFDVKFISFLPALGFFIHSHPIGL